MQDSLLSFPADNPPALRLYSPPDDPQPPTPAEQRALILKIARNDDLCASVQPGGACRALPGTPAKVEVMGERRARKENLHHPDDPDVSDCRAMGLIRLEDPANGAAAWICEDDLERRAASTTFWGIADELEEHEAQEAVAPPEEIELGRQPTFAEIYWARTQHGQGRVTIREATRRRRQARKAA